MIYPLVQYLGNKEINETLISIVGSYASLIGVLIAIFQIKNLTNKTDAVKTALNEIKTNKQYANMVFTTKEFLPIIHDAKSFLKNEQFELALYCLEYIRKRLTKIAKTTNSKTEKINDKHQCSKLLINLQNTIHNITNMNNSSYNTGNLKINNINENLSNIYDWIDELHEYHINYLADRIQI